MPWSLDDFFSKQGPVPARAEENRRFARKYFRHPATAHLTTSLPAFIRATEQVVVYSCDLSLSGVGFLIDRQLYPGELVRITLPSIGTKEVLVQRCLRIAERCYCVGGMFDSPIPATACRGI